MGLKVSNCASCFALFVLLVLMTLPSSPIIAQLNSDECLVRTNGGFTTKQALRVGNLSNQTSNLGFEAWENTSALNLVDRSYATSNIPAWNRSHKLHFNNFNFNIPTGAVIEGIQVIMYGKADTLGRPRDFQLFLTDGSGNPKGNNKANQAIVGTPWDGIDIDSSAMWKYGYNTDLWGTSWTASDINSSAFGFTLQLINLHPEDARAYLDQVRIMVSYRSVPKHCNEACIPYYVYENEDVVDYQWTLPQGFENHPDVGGFKNVVNMYPSTASFGVYELCVTRTFENGPSDNCCLAFEYSSCLLASLGDMVWEDLNGDGIFQPGEPPLAGVRVKLYDEGLHKIGETYTDANGNYSFDSLEPTGYIVNIDGAEMIPLTGSGTGVHSSNFSNIYLPNSSDIVSLDGGDVNNNVDFGLYRNGVISGLIWVDQNGDGLRSNDELTSEGTVQLLDEQDNILATQEVDATGLYSFDDLSPGQYYLAFDTLGQDFEPTDQHIGTNQAIDSDIDSTRTTAIIQLVSGQHQANIDAGFSLKSGDITGQIWKDDNGDSINDGESGIEGVTVSLYDCAQQLISTVMTDNMGVYLFPDILAGVEYYLEMEIPANHEVSPLANDNIFNPSGATDCNMLLGGATMGLDGGLTPLNSVGDQIWLDMNRDGIYTSDEPGLEAIAIDLVDGDGTTIASTTTDVNGNYLLEGLLPGSYQIVLSQVTDELELTEEKVGMDPTTDSDFDALDGPWFDLAGGQDFLDMDAGFILKAATINGLVWRDGNGTGFIESGEENMSEIRVTLYNCDDELIATTMTDSLGFYTFEEVMPVNDYYLFFDKSTDFAYSFAPGDTHVTHANGDGTTDCFYLNPAQEINQNAGLAERVGFGDFVWMDENKNGQQDPDELGLEGIMIFARDIMGNSVDSTFTSADGSYSFTGLYPAKYSAHILDYDAAMEITENHVVQGSPLNSVFYEENNELRTTAFQLYDGRYKENIDAGFQMRAGGIEGQAWIDGNGDGIRDTDETAFPDLMVTLHDCDGNLIADTSTDSQGNYAFADVLADIEYYLSFEPISDFAFSNAGGQSSVTMQNGVGSTDCVMVNNGATVELDAGYAPYGSIGDYVWIDENRDGLQDSDEQGLIDVLLVLLDENNMPVDSSYTDLNGAYSFDQLYPAVYTVTIPDADSNYELTEYNNPASPNENSSFDLQLGVPVAEMIEVYDGRNIMDVDAGFILKIGSISGTIWRDGDGDGALGLDEAPFPNIHVILFDCDGNLIESTSSDADGFYEFTGVLPGDYYVQVNSQQGFEFSMPGIDSNITEQNGAGTSDCESLLANESLSFGIGFIPLGFLGDYVWFDENEDGIQDSNESGISDILVTLIAEDGTPVFEVFTDGEGEYAFIDIFPGQYYIQISASSALNLSPLMQGTDPALDSDFEIINGDIRTALFSVADGQSNIDYDAGLFTSENSGITGHVFHDVYADGIRDSDDNFFGGFTVNLLDSDGNLLLFSITDGDGYYEFMNLPEGDYYVSFEKDAGDVYSMANVGSDDTDSDVTENEYANATERITLAVDQIVNNVDAGIFTPAFIGDYVWSDIDYDGIQNSLESGMPDVEVVLFDENQDQILATVTSDSEGAYLFDGLLPGKYYLAIAESDTYIFATPFGGGDVSSDSDIMSTLNGYGFTSLIELKSGEGTLDIDFGISEDFNPPPPPPPPLDDPMIEGYVWEDMNGDGLRNSEMGTNGVRVVLINENGISSNSMDTESLDGQPGYYKFEDVMPGKYYLEFQMDVAAVATQASTGNDAALNSGVTETNGKFSTDIFDFDSTEIVSLNAGYYYPVSLGDYVWSDLNNNGIQEPAEPGINDILLRLYNTEGVQLGLTTTRFDPINFDPGYYAFQDLAPGDYYIAVNLPADTYFADHLMGSNTAMDSDFDDSNGLGTSRTISLRSGQEDLSIDAGLIQEPGRIGSHLFVDRNGNGVFDDDEDGINGVKVTLFTDNNLEVINTTTSTGDDGYMGYYIFEDIQPGNYYVVFDIPDGYLATVPDLGGDDGKDSDITHVLAYGATNIFDLDSGEDNFEVDGGIYRPSSVGDWVWIDYNQDGIQSMNDEGFGNVELKLSRMGEGVIATVFSDADGFYMFDDLRAGSYTIQAMLPSGYAFTQQFAGADDQSDSNADMFGMTDGFDLEFGQQVSHVDIGFTEASITVGDRIWEDFNANGLQDFQEPGMANVVVNLLDMSGDVVQTVTTNASGIYSFFNPMPGDYVIEIELPADYEVSPKNQGFDVFSDSDFNTDGKTDVLFLTNGIYLADIDGGIFKETFIAPLELDEVLELSAQQIDDYIQLDWTDQHKVEGHTYELWRSNFDQTATHLATLEVNPNEHSRQYMDSDIEVGGQYQYQLIKKSKDGYQIDHVYAEVQLSMTKLSKTVVYPNPTAERLYIDYKYKAASAEWLEVKLISTSGQIQMQETMYGDTYIDVSALPSGMYNLHIKIGRQTDIHQIMIE